MIFLMQMFSYFFLVGIHPGYWTAPVGLPSLLPILAGYGAGAGLALLGRYLLSRKGSTVWSPTTQLLFAAAALTFGFAVDLHSWRAHGLDPTLSSQGAIVYAMLGWQGLTIAIVILMAPYLAARTSAGLVTRPRNTTFDVITLFMLYAAAQGALGALVTRFVPGGA